MDFGNGDKPNGHVLFSLRLFGDLPADILSVAVLCVQSLPAASSRGAEVLPFKEHCARRPPTSLSAAGQPRKLGSGENQRLWQRSRARPDGKCVRRYSQHVHVLFIFVLHRLLYLESCNIVDWSAGA